MIRRYAITLFALAALLSVAVQPGSGVAAETGKSPRAVYPESIYRFDPVMEGAEIKHDFIVENHGDAPLVIQKVQPD